MEGKRLLRTLRLTNFLSYGPEGTEIELQPLNVLIGPNGSGKSNFIEAIGLLKAAPKDIAAPIHDGGGIAEWVWKGQEAETGTSTSIDLGIETTVSYSQGSLPLRHRFQLSTIGPHFKVTEEEITDVPKGGSEPTVYYSCYDGEPVLRISGESVTTTTPPPTEPNVYPQDLVFGQSVLSQRKDPDRYPQLTYLGNAFSDIQLFRTCNLGLKSPLRGPQPASGPASFLFEDGRNLGMVLNDLLNRPSTKRVLLDKLQGFYEYVGDVTTKVYAGTVETSFHERGFAESTPSIRLSDGALLYLRLLTILCHPSPPPLVCIEEPEIGLHPDIIPKVADLLVEASERMQLVVTTHSDILVSALTHVPEAVVVCERDDWGSHLRRLDPDQLKEWLEKYCLGEAWLSGEIGGTT